MSSKNKLEYIQFFRFMAITLVVLAHSLNRVSNYYNFLNLESFVKTIEFFFTSGVDLFFIISGFIMAYVTHDKIFFFKARRFILKRLLRIVPTYWIVSLAVLFLLTIAPQYFNKTNTNLAHALGSFLFLPISSPSGSFSPLLGVGWSLNMEVYFYIILAVFIRIFKNEYLIPVFCFFSFSTAIGFFIGHREVNYAYSLITSSLMLEFVLGLFAFKIYMSSILSKLNSYVFLLFGIFLLSLPFFIEYKHEFRFIYFGMGYFFIILSSSFFLEKMKFLHNIIMIGDASYAIYLTHYFVLSALLLIIPVENFISFLFFMFVSYLICVIVGVIFYLKIEKFIGNKISLFLGGRNV